MTNSIDDAIAQAKAQAEATAATAPQGAVQTYTPTQQQGTVTAYAAPTPVTVDDITTGAMAVDGWLKVKEFGLLTGDSTTIFKEIKVAIDMTQVLPTETIKVGNPANYFHTTDRIMCREGGTWAEALAKANKIDPQARPYISADLPMTVLEDVVVDGVTVVEKDTVLGHSTSTTNRQNLAAFMKAVKEKGWENEVVNVKITAQRRTNPKGHTWGVLQFELIEG